MMKRPTSLIMCFFCFGMIWQACKSPDGVGEDLGFELVQEFFIFQEINGQLIQRPYLVHLPENYDPSISYPVLFAFHGNGGNRQGWVGSLQPILDSGECIGLYPQGYLNSWNLGFEASSADDLSFVALILENLEEGFNVDMESLYAIGFSNGAALVNELAVETNLFKAIAPLASQLNILQEPKPQWPLSVYQVCGELDPVIPIEGGESPVGHTFYSAQASAQLYSSTFSCSVIPSLEFIMGDSLFVYEDCVQGNQIRYRKVQGADHGLNILQDPFFYQRIWDFFKSI